MEDEAVATNLQRLRWLGPLVVVLNALHVLVFLVMATGLTRRGCGLPLEAGPADSAHRHGPGYAGLQLGRAPACATATAACRDAGWDGQRLRGCSACAIAVVALDQWVTPNITPFLIACVGVSLADLLAPSASRWPVPGRLPGVFTKRMGWTQNVPDLLLSNRLNGITACAMGWALSVLLWRKFTTIELQREQLEKVHTELQAKQKELERLTRQDGLTGLFNRNTFVELSRSELKRAQRQGSATTILLLDLDHFKRINDTWGHPAGDAVLRHVAALASTTVRSTDLVGRLGGEEFIVLLPNTSSEAGTQAGRENCACGWRHRSSSGRAPAFPVTASIGLSSTTAEEKHDFDHLYTEADKALYLAKQRGRNRVV